MSRILFGSCFLSPFGDSFCDFLKIANDLSVKLCDNAMQTLSISAYIRISYYNCSHKRVCKQLCVCKHDHEPTIITVRTLKRLPKKAEILRSLTTTDSLKART